MANLRAVLTAFAAASLLVAGLTGAAAAETSSSSSGSTSTTTSSSTAVPSTSSSTAVPSTTVPGSVDGESTTTSTTTVPDTDVEPTAEGATTTTADPLIDEPEGEEVPETDATVPEPTGAYAGQGEYEPPDVVWSSVRAAEAKVVEAQAERDALVAEVDGLRGLHRELLDEQSALGEAAEEAAAEIAEAETTLQRRAIAGFMHDETLESAVLGSLRASEHDTILDFGIRQRMLRTLLDQDDEAIGAYLTLRAGIDADVLSGIDEIRAVVSAIAAVEEEIALAADAIAQAEDEAEAFRAGSAIYIDDLVFPVGSGYGRPLIDSFGFPRMPGTPDEHWHEGIDIFAPAGTPLLATERGVITRVGSSRLGGLTVWLRGESGADWYYAHLQSHAPGIHEGMVVEAGDLLGTVGNTGNAVGTPPHLHMELHPGGGDPVNPYPLLSVIANRDGV